MSQKVPITNGKLLTLASSDQDLKMFLFEKMMFPKVAEFYKRNTIIIKSLHESHQRLIDKYFERNEDGSIKYTALTGVSLTEKWHELDNIPEPIYKHGMTKEMFEIEQKEWSLKEKMMEV